ncbi:hypothetical protein [Phenylobacterium aquaticum]|uniref:hypothetical protein n=1 Tax=Phenylobacterium aquaticum TaxID=1763816 RepID=UPI001F5D72DC|nr:hypothetical protein [Phenylobacterium aquaticum]
MIMTSLRVFPSLFVGRRSLVDAVVVDVAGEDPSRTAFTCGACGEPILAANGPEELRDVVVKCRCGEYNQL